MKNDKNKDGKTFSEYFLRLPEEGGLWVRVPALPIEGKEVRSYLNKKVSDDRRFVSVVDVEIQK